MIGTINLDNLILDKISQTVEITGIESKQYIDIDGLIIDWVGKEHDRFVDQVKATDHYVRKRIPIVVYDRYMRITIKEYEWLSKFHVKFFEPRLIHRYGFSYLPQWQNFIDLSFLESNDNRPIDIAYDGPTIDSIEKYYTSYMDKYPDRKISFGGGDPVDWDQVKFYVAIGSRNDYSQGYLSESVFEAMKHGCMVLLPYEHKYFHCMFRHDIVTDIDIMEYFISTFTQTMREDAIYGVYRSITEHYQEFTIDYAVDKLLGALK